MARRDLFWSTAAYLVLGQESDDTILRSLNRELGRQEQAGIGDVARLVKITDQTNLS